MESPMWKRAVAPAVPRGASAGLELRYRRECKAAVASERSDDIRRLRERQDGDRLRGRHTANHVSGAAPNLLELARQEAGREMTEDECRRYRRRSCEG